MSEKICFNCNYKNGSDSDFCQECGSPLNLEKYIDSKKIDKSISDKIRSIFGKRRIDNINSEIEDFILLYEDLKNFDGDLINFKSGKFNKDEFKSKYSPSLKLDDFEYLDEINKDADLNKKLLFLKKVKSFIKNFDEESKKSQTLLNKINLRINDINSYNKDLSDLLELDEFLNVNHKNDLILDYKSTFDFFDRKRVKELNIDSKNVIDEFTNSYLTLDAQFEKHNEEIKVKRHEQLIGESEDKVREFSKRIDDLKVSTEYISTDSLNELKEEFKEYYDILKEEDLSDFSSKSDIEKFFKYYENLDDIVEKLNENIGIQILEDELYSRKDELDEFTNDLNKLVEDDVYITYVKRDELKDKYEDLYNLTKQLRAKTDLKADFEEFLKIYEKFDSKIKSMNKTYVKKELDKYKDFFDNIDGKKLDAKQRRAVVVNEQNSQIIAGAGCGKTLTVNAKVRYLIEKKGVNPNKILCLSYSRASVGDLADKLPKGIKINTFHSLGGSILKDKDKPSRPDDAALENYIKQYFSENVINNEKLCEDIFEFYSYYYYDSINEEDVDSLGEVYDIIEAKDFKTLKSLYGGDNEKITSDNKKVKSLEELIIANYLFAHQIDYEYEKVFECDNKYFMQHKDFCFNLIFNDLKEITDYPEIMDYLVDNLLDVFEVKEHVEIKDHVPDFYLTENGIYLEHFGVNRDCEALWLDKKDSDKYREGIKWKRDLHRKYGSTLLETYSYYMKENRLLLRLEEKLEAAGVEIKEIDFQYLVKKIVERNKVNRFISFIDLIKTFIELFKGNDYSVDKFDEFKKLNQENENDFDKKRTSLFLNIVEDIYVGYENYLKQAKKIDFNDMVNNATHEVKKGNLKSNWDYIIVDEYQDTSYTRYNLIKAIQDKTGAKVCVVGDDWQSIYRFSGCDVELFTKFEKFFKNPEKLTIETTYRNSQELIDISGRFIKKNTNQISKSLKSKKKSTPKPVKLAYYNKNSKGDKVKKMKQIVDRIAEKSDEILILGRNNSAINDFIEGELFKKTRKEGKLIYPKNKDLNITFLSVHKSKGLEEDNVILLNLENNVRGFPNQMRDDPLMNFVIKDSDQFEYGEERRLFYVALTRTKNNVYLLVPDTDKSVFVEELEENIEDLEVLFENDSMHTIDDVDEFMKDRSFHSIKTKLKCPLCKTGDIVLKLINNKSGKSIYKFLDCSHRQCDWSGGYYNSDIEFLDEIEFCPKCGAVMQVKNGRYGPFFTCPNKCKTPNIEGEKLERVNKIIEEMESKIEFEIHKSDLTCPKCSEGKVILKINPENKHKHFACSNISCDWHGGKTTIDKSDLDKIEICPDCNCVLTLKEGRKGKFYGCSNYPKCRYTKDLNEDSSPKDNFNESSDEDFGLCPRCGSKLVKRNGSKGPFIGCSGFPKCRFTKDIGESTQTVSDVDEDVELCPRCGSKLVRRNGSRGPFMGCSGFPKCRFTKDID